MASSATTKVPLGATTTNRKWYLDVYDDDDTSVLGVFGMTEFQPATEPTLQEDSDFDGEGYKSQSSTALAWSCTGKLRRGVTTADATEYDPGQERLREASNLIGTGNSVKIRYYEMEPDGPRVEAWSGRAAVTWSEDGGGMDALSMVSFTLTGQGKRVAIAHPDAAA